MGVVRRNIHHPTSNRLRSEGGLLNLESVFGKGNSKPDSKPGTCINHRTARDSHP